MDRENDAKWFEAAQNIHQARQLYEKIVAVNPMWEREARVELAKIIEINQQEYSDYMQQRLQAMQQQQQRMVENTYKYQDTGNLHYQQTKTQDELDFEAGMKEVEDFLKSNPYEAINEKATAEKETKTGAGVGETSH